jgi:DNA polymerase-3 subunit alpha
MPAAAITDHGNMYGVKIFAEAAKAAGVKPIFGSEFYVADDLYKKDGRSSAEYRHLILLAKNETGFKNLVKLSSISFVDGFYYKPRIDLKTLQTHSAGLICLSACLAGEIPALLLKNDYEGAVKAALRFKEMFGADDFYIELQDHGMKEQAMINPMLIKIARQIGVKLVCTNDVHYIERTDSEMQDILMCISTQRRIDDPNRMHFESDQLYLKDYDEMSEKFGYIPEALSNTLEIAEKCNVSIYPKRSLMPTFVPPDGKSPKDYIRELCEAGLKKRYKTVTTAIRERADFELGVIDRMGFNEYYLIVWDFITYAESKGIVVGPGRGSGVGSIVAYAIGITKVDPLKYNLLFERFLNPERISMPDFDIDFCYERRGEVIDYVVDKYKADKVAQIVTFGTLAAKAAIKDVARVMNVPYGEVDRLTKLIPYGKVDLKKVFGLSGGSEKGAEIPELKQIYESDPIMKKVVDMAIKLEGVPRNTSTHAAGVVICRETISDYIPLQRNGDDITTQLSMNEVEEAGLLKMDFLGLRTLTDVRKAIEYVYERTGKKIDFYNMQYNDPQVFKMIAQGKTDGVFQLESAGMKRFMKELVPENMEDIIAGISLYRPGPMESIKDYIKDKKNADKITYKTPLLKPILDITYGCIIYQEQVMQIFRALGGYSLAQADGVRRMMGKKKAEEMKRQKELFINGKVDKNGNVVIEGALRRGVDARAAEEIFEQMEAFAGYAFNKSHAAAYAFLSYQTAYLKRYYFVEFMAAVLNNRIGNIDEITKFINYSAASGIRVLQPDINKSATRFSVDGESLRFGLCAIKGVGENAIERILEERKSGGDFKNLADFFSRVDHKYLNKRMIEGMIKSGTFDCFGGFRSQYTAVYESLYERIGQEVKARQSGQFSMFEMIEDTTQAVVLPDIRELNVKDKLMQEKEVLGVYVTGHPLQDYRERFLHYSFNTSMIEPDAADDEDEVAVAVEKVRREDVKVNAGGLLSRVKRIVTKSGKPMAACRLEDLYGSIEIILFPRQYEKYKNFLIEDSFVELSGTLTFKDETKILCEEIKIVNETSAPDDAAGRKKTKTVRKLYLNLNGEQLDDIYNILGFYAGDIPVFAVRGQKSYDMKISVNFSTGLKNELMTILDEERIVLVTKEVGGL